MAVGVHGEDASAEVAQHVVRLELYLAHLRRERFALGAHHVHPARHVGRHDRHKGKNGELDPDARREGCRVTPEHVGEVQQPGEQRDETGIRRRHQQRGDGDEDDVEAREIAVRAASHVDDCGDQ